MRGEHACAGKGGENDPVGHSLSFRGKKELYLAAAQMIADYAAGRFGKRWASWKPEIPPKRLSISRRL